MVGTQIFCEIGQAIIHELHAIYIFKLPYFHRFITLKCFSYDLDLMCINRPPDRFTNQVRVISPEVMENNWDISFPWLDLELEITGIMCRLPKFTCDMAVIPNFIISSFQNLDFFHYFQK